MHAVLIFDLESQPLKQYPETDTSRHRLRRNIQSSRLQEQLMDIRYVNFTYIMSRIFTVHIGWR